MLSQKDLDLIKEMSMAFAEDICVGSNDGYCQSLPDGRTDSRPHEEFDYDPDTGEEVPPAHGRYAFLNALSRSEDETTMRRAIKLRWKLFARGLGKVVSEMIEEMDEESDGSM